MQKSFSTWQKATITVTPHYNRFQEADLQKLPAADELDIKVDIAKDKRPAAKLVLPLAIYSRDKLLAKLFLHLEISAIDKVCVAKKNIPSGEILGPQNIDIKEVDIAAVTEGLFKNIVNINGWEARTRIKEGQPIKEWMVQPVPLLRKGDDVTLIYQEEGIELRFPGKVSEQGYLGDEVRCYRLNSGRNFTGKIINKKTILVR